MAGPGCRGIVCGGCGEPFRKCVCRPLAGELDPLGANEIRAAHEEALAEDADRRELKRLSDAFNSRKRLPGEGDRP